jgi:CheY-like chemotaxis protein
MNHVMVIDDEPAVLASLQLFLQYYFAAKVSSFPNPVEAFDALEQQQILLPTLVIIDALMPAMNGFDAITYWRGHALWKHIPLILHTGTLDIPEVEAVRRYYPDIPILSKLDSLQHKSAIIRQGGFIKDVGYV